MADAFEIAKINKAIPIAKLLSILNISTNNSGFIHCPSHIDKKPSLKIYGLQGRFLEWKCFQCGAHGGSVEFVALLYRISLERAARQLKEKFYNKRDICCKPVVRRDWWARVFRGWEREFCRKILVSIFKLPLEKRAGVYAAWYSYCIQLLDNARLEGENVSLQSLEEQIESFLEFVGVVQEERWNDNTRAIDEVCSHEGAATS